MSTDSRVSVLVAAAGAPWESAALRALDGSPRTHVLKRCVDLNDLLASATTGQAGVALLAADLSGLDAAALTHLDRFDVRPVVVGDQDSDQYPGDGPTARARRLGVTRFVDPDTLAGLGETVVDAGTGTAATAGAPTGAPTGAVEADQQHPAGVERSPGRVVAVWGPAGAPGRTTLAVGLAAELADRGRETLLVDADPYGGTVAQHLGVLDEVSGLLSAARLANSGDLDDARFAAVRRRVAPRLQVLTGLPRADRWHEVRPAALEQVLEDAAGRGHVVVDTGFCLEEDTADLGGTGATRNTMTLVVLAAADEIVVVGAADPVGLARLARGLVELNELLPGVPIRVVVNRMRGSLGWAEHDITGMVEGFVRPLGVHFVVEDQVAADRALMAGASLVEVGDSTLRRSIAELADAFAARPGARRSRFRGRRQAPKSR